MNFIGEHIFPGQFGHFLTILSFVASLVATVAYFKSANATLSEMAAGWKRLARAAFMIECFSVFSVFITIYFIISTHKFEYAYAWNHSSMALSPKYLFACIWEAQEGSFLLWTIWHCVLGLILMFRAGKWEAPVMTVISFAQVCLATMIIGLYFGTARVGINPFSLVRQLDVMQNAPIFSRPDYLSLAFMKDGQGLNQLLQNYWMVIHPPILFLDEPTVGVDVQTRHAMIEYLKELNKSGTTLIYTSHQLKEAEDLCNKIALFDDGRIIANGTLDQLLTENREEHLEGLFIKLTGKAYRDANV